MYALFDTFNENEISRHRTLKGAAKAQVKHSEAVRRANGPNAYITYAVRRADDTALTEDEYDEYEAERVALFE